jgi:hypothetical protein
MISIAEAIELNEQLQQRFTINNTITAPSLTGQNLRVLAKSVHKDLARNKTRMRRTNMRGILCYFVSKEAEQIGTWDYQIVSNFTDEMMRLVATDQDKRQYLELANHVNEIIDSFCPRRLH